MGFTVRYFLGTLVVFLFSHGFSEASSSSNSSVKLEKSEPYSKKEEQIDYNIDKYVSEDFHNISNTYTLPTSPDNKPFVNDDDFHEFHPTTPFYEVPSATDFSSELTTPFSKIFDEKYDRTVKSIPTFEDSHEHPEEDDTSESTELTLDKYQEATKNNQTDSTFVYTEHKNIVGNSNARRNNSLHKDLDVETSRNLEFRSSYNDTQIIDEGDEEDVNNNIAKERENDEETEEESGVTSPKPDENDTEKVAETQTKVDFQVVSENATTVKPTTTTTRKSVTLLTKPPTSNTKNSSFNSILSNKIIETETVKAAADVKTTTETTINFNKTTDVPTTVTTVTRVERTEVTVTVVKPNKTEQQVQENQIVPIQIVAPTSTTATKTTEATTAETTTAETATTAITTDSTIEVTTSTETTTTTEGTTIYEEETTTTEPSIQIRTSKGFSFTPDTSSTIRIDSTTLNNATEETPIPSPSTVTSEIPTTEETTSVQTEKEIETTTTTATVPVEISSEITARITETTAVVNNDIKKLPFNETTQGTTSESTDNSSTDADELNTTPPEGNGGTIAAIAISSVGAVCLILLAGLLYVMKKRQKRFNYGQRCRPVSLADYSVDNVSVQNSIRRKGMSMRSSKRSYGNPAFDDPSSISHPLNFAALARFANNSEEVRAEFEEIPQIFARTNELPEGCDTKNRYANVIPLPETRVFLSTIDGYPNSDYINANYVTGPKNTKGYYIACQAPMQTTVDDFWRMVWEQESKVILMLTHLFENGVEKCFDYLPPSEVSDCHRLFGDFQITLKRREVKDKYIISTAQIKNMVSNSWREVTHFWYLGWPEKGVPSEVNSLIAFLIEARSFMKSSSLNKKETTNGNAIREVPKINPVVVHCSPGTGRTGVVLACDIAIREFEQTRLVDIPKIVYKIRRDRAGAVQTKEQYSFIYKVINLYATKLTGGALDSF